MASAAEITKRVLERKGSTVGIVSLNGDDAVVLARAYQREQDAKKRLIADAWLNRNEHDDNVSVTIPIATWREFTERAFLAEQEKETR